MNLHPKKIPDAGQGKPSRTARIVSVTSGKLKNFGWDGAMLGSAVLILIGIMVAVSLMRKADERARMNEKAEVLLRLKTRESVLLLEIRRDFPKLWGMSHPPDSAITVLQDESAGKTGKD